MIFRFALAGERWNWPVEGDDSVCAFRELLQRAGIAYVVAREAETPEVAEAAAAERDRYRTALEQIYRQGRGVHVEIAREALNG